MQMMRFPRSLKQKSKTAQRLLIDLKDKVSVEETFEKMGMEPVSVSGIREENSGARNDAIEALTALGYSASESMKAVNAVEITEGMTGDAILKMALKHMF